VRVEGGCRKDVEGKGDGQAMVVRCRPALALRVVASSASALRVLVASSCVVVASSRGCAVASSYRRPVSQRGGLGRRWEGGAYRVVLK